MSTTTSYTVKSGDTLSQIAQQRGLTTNDLLNVNKLENPDQLSVGQKLQIPQTPSPAGQLPQDQDGSWSTTLLRFVDALERPITGLGVRVTDGIKDWTGTTNGEGCIQGISCEKPDAQLQIHVRRAPHKGGGEKQVSSYTPMAGRQTVVLKSGKHVHNAGMRLHKDSPQTPPKLMKHETPGTRVETNTEEGHPLTCVKGGECPNDDDLMLGPNNEFRNQVKAAATSAGIVPQAVAAVMNAEAAKVKGKWQAHSMSPKSSATGMTQFLDGSWLDMALRDGTYLNSKATTEHWLSKDTNGHWQFKKVDGKYITQPKLLGKLMKLIKPKRHASDANLQKLLDLRYEPEYAIRTAMDYAKANLSALKAKGYDVAGLNDTEKARIMYLCHHLGIGDAVKFIQETITESSAKHLLTVQVGEKAADSHYEEYSDWIQAHRYWLDGFINSHITPSGFSCPGGKQKSFMREENSSSLLQITGSLKK